MNATFLFWFTNVVKNDLRMSRGVILILDVNPKGYEVSEHIAKKFKVNPWMISTLKDTKPNLSTNPGACMT